MGWDWIGLRLRWGRVGWYDEVCSGFEDFGDYWCGLNGF